MRNDTREESGFDFYFDYYVVPGDVRQQAWHVLSFALDVAVTWMMARELLLVLVPNIEQNSV